jgi:hypothetical protein
MVVELFRDFGEFTTDVRLNYHDIQILRTYSYCSMGAVLGDRLVIDPASRGPYDRTITMISDKLLERAPWLFERKTKNGPLYWSSQAMEAAKGRESFLLWRRNLGLETYGL